MCRACLTGHCRPRSSRLGSTPRARHSSYYEILEDEVTTALEEIKPLRRERGANPRSTLHARSSRRRARLDCSPPYAGPTSTPTPTISISWRPARMRRWRPASLTASRSSPSCRALPARSAPGVPGASWPPFSPDPPSVGAEGLPFPQHLSDDTQLERRVALRGRRPRLHRLAAPARQNSLPRPPCCVGTRILLTQESCGTAADLA